MSMQDPIANMLTMIRNGQKARHKHIVLFSSKVKERIANILKEEGYIQDYSCAEMPNNAKQLTIYLRYYNKVPVIAKIKRISRPGLRIYKSSAELKSIHGFGIAIMSTSQGVMSNAVAKQKGIGGEVICEVA